MILEILLLYHVNQRPTSASPFPFSVPSLNIPPMASPDLADLAGADGSESNSSLFPPGDEGDSATPKYDQPLLKPDSSPTAALASAAVPISSEELDRKYPPYVRRDAYGTMGREKLPMTIMCTSHNFGMEGTTTNGDFLLPFKSGAFLAKAPVLPVILRYPYHRFCPAWDSISGVRHVCLLLCQFVNHLEVIHLPVYYPSDQEKEDPKLYANNVWKLMATEGNLMLRDVGLAEKRIYLAVLNGMRFHS